LTANKKKSRYVVNVLKWTSIQKAIFCKQSVDTEKRNY